MGIYEDWLNKNRGGGNTSTPSTSSKSSGSSANDDIYKDWQRKNGQAVEEEQPKERTGFLNPVVDAILSPFGKKTTEAINPTGEWKYDPNYKSPSRQYADMTTHEQRRSERLGLTPEPAPTPTYEEATVLARGERNAERRDAQANQPSRSRYEELNRQLQDYETALGMAYTPEAQAEINAKMAPLVNERNDLRDRLGIPTTGERIANIFKAGGSAVAGSYTDTARSLYELGQEARTSRDAAEMADIARQLEKTKQQRADYVAAYGEDSEYVKDADYWIDIYEKQLAGYQASPEAQIGATRETAQIADNIQRISDEATQKAKTDLNGAESFLIDAGIQGVQMATDAAVNLATGMPGSLLPLIARSFGGGTMTARQDGADIKQQVIYGAAVASVEALTEKMFDGLAGLYGKGMADDMTQLVLEKVAKEASPEIKTALTIFLSGAGEAAEEAVSGRLDPWLKAIYDKGESINQTYGSWEGYKQSWADTAYDMLVGFAMGFAGGAVSTEGGTTALTQNTETTENTAPATAPAAEEKAEVKAEPKAEPSPKQALLDTISDGVSNSKAETILNNPELRAEFESVVGAITGSKSEQRNAIKTNAQKVINALTGNAPTVNTEAETATATVNEESNTSTEAPTAEEKAQTTPTTTTEETRSAQNRSEETSEVNEQAEEKPAETQKTEEKQETEKPEQKLTKSQQNVADMLLNDIKSATELSNATNEISQATIDKITSNDTLINAAEALAGTDFPKNRKAQAQFLNTLAQDMAQYGTPDAYLVAKMAQDNDIMSTEQSMQYEIDKLNEQIEALQKSGEQEKAAALTKQRNELQSMAKYSEEQLREEIKAAEMLGQWEKRKALARQRNRLIRQRLTKHITKTADTLTKTLKTASENKFVPADFVKETTQFIEAINELRMDPNAETKTGRKAYEKFTQIEDEFSRLRDAVTTYEDGSETIGEGFSEDVLAMLNGAKEILRDTTWGEMGEAELTTIDNALKAMNKSIGDARKIILKGKAETAYRIGSEMENEVKTEAKGGDTALQNYSQLMERPLSFFEKMAGYKKGSIWRAMYDMLNDGQKKAIELRLQAADRFKNLVGNYKEYKTLRDTVEIEGLKDADGNNIKISRGMMLSLYMHLLNEQNANHIAGGGLTIADVQDYYSNHHDKGFGIGRSRAMGMSSEMSKLNHDLRNAKAELERATNNGATDEQIAKYQSKVDQLTQDISDRAEQERVRIEKMAQIIEEKMTPYEREFVQTTQDFFKWAQNTLNKTTIDVYGFAKALVDNYFPIATDSNFRNITMDEMGGTTKSLENTGILQQRTRSNSPMYLLDISDVLDSYMKDMSQISGLMPAIKNFNKVYNTSKAGFDSSLRDTMRKTFGNRADTYITNLIADLQGGRKLKSDVLDSLLSTTRGNFAASVLTLNARVALSQRASWFNAASVVGWQNLMKSIGMKNADLDLIRQYSPLLAARTSDNTTPSFSDNRTDLASQRNRITRKVGFLLNWINNADNQTVRSLWSAAELYVREQNADLAEGTDAYYKEVGKVFDEIIERTQPGYEVMQRPDILRSPKTLVRSLTMFMTQRLQNYNEVHDQLMRAAKYAQDYKAGRNGVTQQDVADARRGAVNATSGMVASSLALVMMKAGVDAILHKTKNYRDKETGELTPESVVTRILDYTAESLASNILGGSELYAATRSLLTHSKYYVSSVPGVDTIYDMAEDIIGAFQATEKNRPQKIRKAAESVATAFGVPLSNADQYVDAVLRWADDYKTGEILEADAEYTTAQNKLRLYNALEENDDDRISSILAQMGENAEKNATAEIKDRYDVGDINAAEARRMLKDIGYSESKANEMLESWDESAEKKAVIDAFKDTYSNTKLSDSNIIRYQKSEDKPNVFVYEKATAEIEKQYEKSIGSMTKTEMAEYIANTDWLNEIEKRQLWNTFEADGKLDAVRNANVDVADFLALYATGNRLEQATANKTKTGEDTRDYSAVDAIMDVYNKNIRTAAQTSLIADEYSWFDELGAAAKLDMDSRTWFTFYDKYREIDKEDLTATEKHDEFAKYVDRSGLTDDQKELIKSQLNYRTMMTVKDTRYDKMVANGMDSDLADEYCTAFTKLKPLDGKSNVSDSQKAAVIWSDTRYSVESRMNNLVMSGIRPSQADFALWLDQNVSYSEAVHYWDMISAIDPDNPWKTSYKDALKKAKKAK